MMGSGMTCDVVAGLNRCKRVGIVYWGGDLREGFDLTRQELPGQFDFCWLHASRTGTSSGTTRARTTLSSVEDYEQFRQLLMLCLKRCCDVVFKKTVQALACKEKGFPSIPTQEGR